MRAVRGEAPAGTEGYRPADGNKGGDVRGVRKKKVLQNVSNDKIRSGARIQPQIGSIYKSELGDWFQCVERMRSGAYLFAGLYSRRTVVSRYVVWKKDGVWLPGN